MPKRPQSATVHLKVRMKEPVRAALEKAAAKRGTSMNSEIVRVLERSFGFDERLGGTDVAAILEVVGAAMKLAGETGGFLATHKISKHGAWLVNPWAFDAALNAAVAVLKAHRPPGDIVEPKWEIDEVVGGDPEETKAQLHRLLKDLGPMMAAYNTRNQKQGGENE